MVTGKRRASWAPILEGALQEDALAHLHDIAGAVSAAAPDSAYETATRALLHGYLERAGLAARRGTQETLLVEALEQLSREEVGPAFFGGYTGVAWVFDHLAHLEPGLLTEDCNEAIDQRLSEVLALGHADFEYDLISGLVGYGVYCLERHHRPSARALLEQIVALLARLALPREKGLTWWTAPNQLFPIGRQAYPQGCMNVGVAHGVPGIISFLAGAYDCDVARQQTGRLLTGAVEWVLSQEKADGTFPYAVRPDGSPEQKPMRTAWCYGDPGVAATLLQAALALDQPAWKELAVAHALRAALRPADSHGVVDAGLCHGAAGLAHLFNRFFQHSGDERLRSASLHWFAEVLRHRVPGHEGVAGVRSFGPRRLGDAMGWHPDASLLAGAVGVALALLAGATALEPHWDRALLISLPGRFGN